MTRDRQPIESDRRDLVKGAAFGVLAAALPTGQAAAQAARPGAPPAASAAAPIIARTIPRTQESLPALGLGTFLTFDLLPGQNRERLREVVRIHCEAGCRVIDTSPLYGSGEVSTGQFVNELGLADQLFIANKIWSTGEFLADESHARRSITHSQLRLWRERFDLVQCHSLVNVEIAVPILQAWKRAGLTRFTGITHYENDYHDALVRWIERGAVDFVQVNYSIANRAAEARVLRAAADNGVAVLTNMPLEKARLHQVVQGRPLPDFAREFGAQNWAQFFLKWVMAHPAVTTVLAATSDPAHASENVGALRGPLPDADLRARMVRHMEGIPGFERIGEAAWYPGKRYAGLIARGQAELRARG